MNNFIKPLLTLAEVEKRARMGKVRDIDFLMENLETNGTFINTRMIDYALGLVCTEEGGKRIKHFLFNGSRIQRNYAALYFKRQGNTWLLDEAVKKGCIDKIQAYSR